MGYKYLENNAENMRIVEEEMDYMVRKTATKEEKAKRIRRSPEILIKELDKKRKKLEERIYKSNKEFVHYIGAAVLKRADFDFSSLTRQDIEDVANGTGKGEIIVTDIIKKANV